MQETNNETVENIEEAAEATPEIIDKASDPVNDQYNQNMN